MNKQKTVQGELRELAAKLDKESYNISAFRRRKSLDCTSNHKLAHHTLSTEVGRDDSKIQHHSAEKQPSNEKRYSRRAAPSSNRNKKKSHITDYNYTQHFLTRRNTTNHSELNQKIAADTVDAPSKDKLTSLPKTTAIDVRNLAEKAIFKGKLLTDSHFEDLINQVLLERCSDENFDRNIPNPALKRYEIDRNSLLSHGISAANASRILKSLFVYSIGFNNLLSEVGHHKLPVKKNLWKVFSILIEHCSGGSFETIISDIQRENEKQQACLKEQIEKQQELIEHNELRNKEKNGKLFQENRDLREESERLELDRKMMQESNEEFERAFAEEISLRLMFERKISDLHRLYRELELKHHKLFSDFQLKINELTYFKEKSQFYYNENLQLKKERAALDDELSERATQLRQNEETISKLKKEVHDQFSAESQRKLENKLSEHLLGQKEIKERQLAHLLKSAQSTISVHEKSHQSLLSEYYRSLDENNRLIRQLNGELEDITRRLIQQRDINAGNAHFLSEINILNIKMQEKLQLLNDMEAATRANFSRIEQLELDLQDHLKTIEHLQQTIAANHETLANLKQVNQKLDSSIQQLEKINERHEEREKSTEIELQRVKASSSEWVAKYEASAADLQKVQSKNTILVEQATKVQANLVGNIDKLQYSSKAQEQRYKKMEQELIQKTMEADKIRQAFDNMEEKYKNEKFERDGLEFRYKHSLSAFQNSHLAIKDQNIKIAELERNLSEEALKLKLAHIRYSTLEKKYESERQEQHKRMSQLEEKLTKKQGFVHPMHLEDAQAQVERLLEQKIIIQQTLETEQEDQKILNTEMKEQLMRLEHQTQRQETEFHEALTKKGFELEYEQKKLKSYIQKIDELELTLKAKEIYQESEKHSELNKDKEKRYLEIISQNYFKINTLVSDMETIENHNQELIERVFSNENQIKRQSQLIQSIEREKSELEGINQELVEDSQHLEELKQELLKEINEKECLISSYIPEYKSLRQSPSQKMKRKRDNSPTPNERPCKKTVFARKPSLMEPIISQIKERGEQLMEQNVKQSEKSLGRNEDWRADFSNKLRSSFGYYS